MFVHFIVVVVVGVLIPAPCNYESSRLEFPSEHHVGMLMAFSNFFFSRSLFYDLHDDIGTTTTTTCAPQKRTNDMTICIINKPSNDSVV